jgi:hypothetical protein
MPVGVVMDFPGGTLAQYDQVIGRMGLTPGGAMPDGGLFHWVTRTDSGLRVTDVWESREQFERFAQEQIGPFTQEAGLDEPQITFHEVHNHLWKS